MDGRNDQDTRRKFGQVRVEEAEELCLQRPSTASFLKLHRQKYTWLPPPAFQDQLPPGFELSLQCVIDPDGLRRLYPWDNFETFLALASTGGLAITCQLHGLSAQERYSYRAMRLLFLRAHRMVEHFRHRFDSSQDLAITPSGRAGPEIKDVLPDDLGLDLQNQGHRWSVKELIERGEKAAHVAGCVRPTMAKRIHHGLVEAARLKPLPIPNDKVPRLIRSALFAVDRADESNCELVENVTERLLEALYPHLDDDKRTFDKWFLGPNNSLVHQLAKQKLSPGGELVKEDVRRVLVHLGWQAYEYATNCVLAQMRTFQNALPDPLTDREQLYYEHMHLPQPYLGNLPLVLLGPRLGFVKELLWDLWERLPDQSLVPVFHRLLDYYETMASRRREADRRIKSGRPQQLVQEPSAPPDENQRFQDIAAEVRELKKIDCGCPHRDWLAELKGRPGAKIRILHRCIVCNFEKETTLTRERFTEIGNTFL